MFLLLTDPDQFAVSSDNPSRQHHPEPTSHKPQSTLIFTSPPTFHLNLHQYGHLSRLPLQQLRPQPTPRSPSPLFTGAGAVPLTATRPPKSKISVSTAASGILSNCSRTSPSTRALTRTRDMIQGERMCRDFWGRMRRGGMILDTAMQAEQEQFLLLQLLLSRSLRQWHLLFRLLLRVHLSLSPSQSLRRNQCSPRLQRHRQLGHSSPCHLLT